MIIPLTINRLKENERAQLYKQVFDNANGRQVLVDILEKLCGYGKDVFATDPRVEARETGKQWVGIELLRIVNSKDGE